MRAGRVRQGAAVVGLCVLAVACQPQDVTKPRLDADVTTVYSHLLSKRDALLGNPTRSGVQVVANCYRGGPKQPDVGAGKDWRCDMSETDASTAPDAPNVMAYLVIVRANGCWTALAQTLSAKAETVDVITMTDPRTGADLPDPLGGFDGCVQT